MDPDGTAPLPPPPERAAPERLADPVPPLDALVALGELVRRAQPALERVAIERAPASPDAPVPDAAPPPEGRERPTGGERPPEPAPNRDAPNRDRGNYLGDGLYAFQGRPSKKLVVYVDPPVHHDVKAAAARRGVTMSELVNAVLRGAGFGDPDA